MIETLYCIDAANHPTKFFAGIIVDGKGTVIEAADIVSYMKRKRWRLSEVRAYCRKRGWHLERVCTYDS